MPCESLQLLSCFDIPQARGIVCLVSFMLGVLAARENLSTIRGKCNGRYEGAMAGEALQLFTGRHIPQSGYFVIAAGQHLPPIGRKSDGCHKLCCEALHLFAGFNVPDSCSVVAVARQYRVSIRSKVNRFDTAGMAYKALQLLAACHIPKSCSLVFTTGKNPPPIG